MTRPWILPLQDVVEADTSRVGQKAARLARLLRAGFTVPPGFCVSADLYRAHLAGSVALGDGGLGGGLREISPTDRGRELEKLRERLREARFSDELLDEARRHYRALPAGPLAVRSSTTTEDLGSGSSAGIYRSILGIDSFEDCLDAIRRCWASFWTEHAYLYREARGIDHFRSSMGVLVQQCIPARAAGVAFTEHPGAPSGRRMVIEGFPGLAAEAAYRHGKPDRFLLDRNALGILERSIAAKTVASRTGERSGVMDGSIPDDEARRPCLEDTVLQRLAAQALRVEELLGEAQDIEWAVDERQIYILQSRPLTGRRWRHPVQVWSNFNVGEVLPGPVSPMTRSLLEPCARRALGQVLKRLGMDLGDVSLTTQISGRLYFNVNLLIGILERLPAAYRIDLNELLGSLGADLQERDVGDLVSRDPSGLEFSRMKMVKGFPGLVAWLLHGALAGGERLARATRERTARVRKLDFAALTDEELRTHLQDTTAELMRCSEGLSASLAAMQYFSALDTVCQRWFPGEDGLAPRLVAGSARVDSAEAALALWRLAAEVAKHRRIDAILRQEHSYPCLREQLSQISAGSHFLARWDRYLEEHGHHAMGELELLNPRWSEDATTVLRHLLSCVDGLDRMDPLGRRAERMRARSELADECSRRLAWNPCKRYVFEFLLHRAARGAVLRENMKNAFVQLLAAIRALLLEVGRRASKRSLLGRVEDVFFLTSDELEFLSTEGGNAVLAYVAERRRAEHERNAAESPPPVVINAVVPDTSNRTVVNEKARVSTSRDRYDGLAVSPGVAMGPARVISGCDGQEMVLPGEVLVAPYSDPGWVPHFLKAVAIVVETGGLLSHGSILARELGVPAVANVAGAMRTIQTGQLVEVDGDRGCVRIVD